MAQDLADHCTLRDDGDDAEGPALTPRAVRHIQRKDPMQQPCPAPMRRQNALLQAYRVAKARGISVQQVHKLVEQRTDSRGLGLLGDPGVNVLQLNVALDKGAPVTAPTMARR
jgi:hypothetical protein